MCIRDRLWLDDIVVEEVTSAEDADLLQRAESLFDSGSYAQALAIAQKFESLDPGNEAVLRHYRCLLYTSRCV